MVNFTTNNSIQENRNLVRKSLSMALLLSRKLFLQISRQSDDVTIALQIGDILHTTDLSCNCNVPYSTRLLYVLQLAKLSHFGCETECYTGNNFISNLPWC